MKNHLCCHQILDGQNFWSIACAVLLTFMTVLVLIQVFSRYILNMPRGFSPRSFVRYSLIWTGFIGAAYAFSTREHMSLTLIRDKFHRQGRTPPCWWSSMV